MCLLSVLVLGENNHKEEELEHDKPGKLNWLLILSIVLVSPS